MKERMVSSAKEAAESMKKSGIKALDKVVSAAGIRKGLEEMHRELAGSAQEVKKSIEKVETVRKGKVRRAKLYYLRGRVGKRAKIKEKL